MPENDYNQTYYEGELNPSYVTASPVTKKGQRKLRRARGRAQTAQAIQTYMTDSKLPKSVLSERARNGDSNAYLSLTAQGRDEDTNRVLRFGAGMLGAGAAAAVGAAAVPVIESIGAGTFALPGFVGTAGRMLGNGLVKAGEYVSPVFNNPVMKFIFSRPVQGAVAAGETAQMGYNWAQTGERPSTSDIIKWGVGTGLGVGLGGGLNEASKAAYEIPGYVKGLAQTGVDLGKEIGNGISKVSPNLKKLKTTAESLDDKLGDAFYKNVVQNGAKGINYSFKKIQDWFPNFYNRVNVPSYRVIKMMNEKVPIGLRREMKDFIIDYNLSKSYPVDSDVNPTLLEFPSNNDIDSYANYIKKTKTRPDSRLDALQNRISHHFNVPHYTLGLDPGGYNAYAEKNRIVLSNDWLRNLKQGDAEEVRRLLAHELQHVSDNALEITNPTAFRHLIDYDTARSSIFGTTTRTRSDLSPWYYNPAEFRAVAAAHTAVSPIGKPFDFKSIPVPSQRLNLIGNVGDKFYVAPNKDNLNKLYDMMTKYPGLKKGGKLIKRK